MPKRVFACCLILVMSGPALADGPADNNPETVRRVPKLGIEVPAADEPQLQSDLAVLKSELDRLRQTDANRQRNERRMSLLPDIEIYFKAVHDALTHQEFFAPNDIVAAKNLLRAGIERAKQLDDAAPWARQSGLVVRGYVSRIDGSAQPYGLVVPESYNPEGTSRVRLDVWFHGRGEALSEVNFLDQRSRQVGQIAPPDTIVLHPYGRYCNAFKFAGEVDVLEAIESVKSRYRIDDDRITVRGFSMGGAACWQFAVHYADRWAAAAPGAGFSETPEFLKFFQQETLDPSSYEKKLWHWYDCTDVALNLFHCPTVAYSGELDVQKQAADIMEQALRKERIDLVHVIGPQTKHSYHPESQKTIERLMGSIAAKGRERVPSTVHFVTYTLKYPRMHWVTVDGLGEHWNGARVDAQWKLPNEVAVTTRNVTDLTLSMPAGWSPFDIRNPVRVTIDGAELEGPQPRSDRSWEFRLHRSEGTWHSGARPIADGTVRKQHDLQGPIDDAFMDSFLFVRPTGKGWHAAPERWAQGELERAIEHWRRQFRGDARVKNDSELTDADIAGSNLILWGDPSSNSVLRKISGNLPISWTAGKIKAGTREFDADRHALIAIYPNPLNPKRYVVLNSSFTYREYDYLNNARQVPKLPDWAIVDLKTPPNSRFPGRIAAADFFGENWELRSSAE